MESDQFVVEALLHLCHGRNGEEEEQKGENNISSDGKECLVSNEKACKKGRRGAGLDPCGSSGGVNNVSKKSISYDEHDALSHGLVKSDCLSSESDGGDIYNSSDCLGSKSSEDIGIGKHMLTQEEGRLTLIGPTISSNLQFRRASEIVQRYRQRGNVLPRQQPGRKDNPVLEQEHLDAQKISKWRLCVRGNRKSELSEAVRTFLDKEMPGWSDEANTRKGINRMVQMQKAEEIVARYRARGNEIPRKLSDRSSPAREQEYKDAQKLTKWKQTLKGNGNSKYRCPEEIRDYLDREMPHWRDEVREKNCLPMQFAMDIVKRYRERGGVLPRQSKGLQGDANVSAASQQEYKDARKLHKWRQTLKGNGNGHHCSDEVRDYLDEHMPNWRGAGGTTRGLVKREKEVTSEESDSTLTSAKKRSRSVPLELSPAEKGEKISPSKSVRCAPQA